MLVLTFVWITSSVKQPRIVFHPSGDSWKHISATVFTTSGLSVWCFLKICLSLNQNSTDWDQCEPVCSAAPLTYPTCDTIKDMSKWSMMHTYTCILDGEIMCNSVYCLFVVCALCCFCDYGGGQQETCQAHSWQWLGFVVALLFFSCLNKLN